MSQNRNVICYKINGRIFINKLSTRKHFIYEQFEINKGSYAYEINKGSYMHMCTSFDGKKYCSINFIVGRRPLGRNKENIGFAITNLARQDDAGVQSNVVQLHDTLYSQLHGTRYSTLNCMINDTLLSTALYTILYYQLHGTR